MRFSSRGGYTKDRQQWSYDHALEVFHDAKVYDEVFDCTLIKKAKSKEDLLCQPIYNFTESDIWRYIREHDIETNPLYEMGYRRIGCIGCPMAGKHRYKEFADFPTYERAYKTAFKKMLEIRKQKGKTYRSGVFSNEEKLFRWWMESDVIDGQINMMEEQP